MKFALIIFALINCSSAVVMNCTYRNGTWAFIGFAYTCEATLLFDDKDHVTELRPNHWSNMTSINVEGIMINNQKLPFLPKGFTNFFENLRAVQISNTSLSVLRGDDLAQFPKLENFDYRMSDVESIDEDLFAYTPNIEFLRIDRNLVTNIGSSTFRGLRKLRQLELNDNLCINKVANNTASISSLIREAAFKCPPTSEITERFILRGEKFESKVTEIFHEEIEPIQYEINALTEVIMEEIVPILCDNKDEIRRLNVRVTELEVMIGVVMKEMKKLMKLHQV